MKLSNLFYLAAITAVAAGAFIGTSSALATSAVLCKTHTALLCQPGDQWDSETIHLVDEGGGKILSDLVDVLCLLLLTLQQPLALASPQSVHTLLSFETCGTDAGHDNCAITVEQQPLLNLLKTGLDAGSLTSTNGQFRVVCEDVFGFIDIDCKYNLTGILFATGAGKTTATETPINKVAGSFLCPIQSFLDLTLKPLPGQTVRILG